VTGHFERAVERLRGVAAFSPDKPDETPETTARALWFAAAGAPRPVTRTGTSLPALDDEQAKTFEQLVERRVTGEPLGYLSGRQEFLGLEFHCAAGALIPRRETEIVGTVALELARTLAAAKGPIRILDLCTGAGNLAVSLAVHEPRALVWATDLEADALVVAARNVSLHEVGDRVRLLRGDLFGALESSPEPAGPFDLIVCNPPYIPSSKAKAMPAEVGGFEPSAAFDGGDFGLSILFRLVSEAPRHLAAGGWLCFELGAGQGRMIEKRLAGQGSYTDVRSVPDPAGTARALVARRAAA
jgi:release factor glutamine methyltransferase